MSLRGCRPRSAPLVIRSGECETSARLSVQDVERFIKRNSKTLGQAALRNELHDLLQRFVDSNLRPDSSYNYKSTQRDNMAAMLLVLDEPALKHDSAVVLLALAVRSYH